MAVFFINRENLQWLIEQSASYSCIGSNPSGLELVGGVYGKKTEYNV